MSRRRPSNQPVKTLTHPNDPSIQVTIQKLTRMQMAELAPLVAKLQRAVQVYDRDGNAVLDNEGDPRVVFQTVMTMEPVMARLKLAVVGWSGINDESGNAIAFKPDMISLLTEEWLDVTTDEEIVDRKTGEKKVESITRAFSTWITERLNDSATWTADPFVSASSTS